jgi:hypothetical protein
MAALKSFTDVILSISGAAVFSEEKTAAAPIKLIDQDPGRRVDRGVSPIHGTPMNLLPLLVPVGLKQGFSAGRRMAVARNGKEDALKQFDRSETL